MDCLNHAPLREHSVEPVPGHTFQTTYFDVRNLYKVVLCRLVQAPHRLCESCQSEARFSAGWTSGLVRCSMGYVTPGKRQTYWLLWNKWMNSSCKIECFRSPILQGICMSPKIISSSKQKSLVFISWLIHNVIILFVFQSLTIINYFCMQNVKASRDLNDFIPVKD